MKKITGILLITVFFMTGCKTENLAVRLDKARFTKDTTYGYNINNPICLKYKNIKDISIIQAYIHNLIRGEIIDSNLKLMKPTPYFNMSIEEIIINRNSITSKPKMRKIYECTIQSEDKKYTFKLYFDTHRKKALKIPVGFLYARLSGNN